MNFSTEIGLIFHIGFLALFFPKRLFDKPNNQ